MNRKPSLLLVFLFFSLLISNFIYAESIANPEYKMEIYRSVDAQKIQSSENILVGAFIYSSEESSGTTNKVYFPERPRIPNKLDVFIVPNCPFAQSALQALNTDLWRKNIEIHYILEENKVSDNTPTRPNDSVGTGSVQVTSLVQRYKSMHGQAELEETLRQMCVRQVYPDKYWEYLTSRDINTSFWTLELKQHGIKPEKIESGVLNNNVKYIVAEDALLCGRLGITSSPTFLWENQNIYVGVGELQKVKGFENVQVEKIGVCTE